MFFAGSLTTRAPIEIRPPVELLEPGHHAQRRGFAAAGGSEQSDELAGSDPQVDAGDRDETTEGTRDIFENEF